MFFWRPGVLAEIGHPEFQNGPLIEREHFRKATVIIRPRGGVGAHPTDGADDFIVGCLQVLMKNRLVVGDPVSEAPDDVHSIMDSFPGFSAAIEKDFVKVRAPQGRVVCLPKQSTQLSEAARTFGCRHRYDAIEHQLARLQNQARQELSEGWKADAVVDGLRRR